MIRAQVSGSESSSPSTPRHRGEVQWQSSSFLDHLARKRAADSAARLNRGMENKWLLAP
jgi:hypothetical protein